MISETFYIRSAMLEDVAALPEIERLAGYMFKSYPRDLGISDDIYENPNSVETFAAAQQAGLLWVGAARKGVLLGERKGLSGGHASYLQRCSLECAILS